MISNHHFKHTFWYFEAQFHTPVHCLTLPKVRAAFLLSTFSAQPMLFCHLQLPCIVSPPCTMLVKQSQRLEFLPAKAQSQWSWMVASLLASLTRRHSPIPLPLPFWGTLHMCYFKKNNTHTFVSLACERIKEEKSPSCSVYSLKQMNQGVVVIKGQVFIAQKDWECRGDGWGGRGGTTECSALRHCHWNVLCDMVSFQSLFKSLFFQFYLFSVTILCENAIFSSALSGSFACWQLSTVFSWTFHVIVVLQNTTVHQHLSWLIAIQIQIKSVIVAVFFFLIGSFLLVVVFYNIFPCRLSGLVHINEIGTIWRNLLCYVR